MGDGVLTRATVGMASSRISAAAAAAPTAMRRLLGLAARDSRGNRSIATPSRPGRQRESDGGRQVRVEARQLVRRRSRCRRSMSIERGSAICDRAGRRVPTAGRPCREATRRRRSRRRAAAAPRRAGCGSSRASSALRRASTQAAARSPCARGRRLVGRRCRAWRFTDSAVSNGSSSPAAIASVSSRPPVPSTRTKRGTPFSCTTTQVTPPPNETMPSAPRAVVIRSPAWASRLPMSASRERDRAVDRRERHESTARDLQPAGLDRGDEPSTVAACAAASSTCMTRLAVLARSTVPRIAKSMTASSSGIGMSSCAWNRSAPASSSRVITGISTWRTISRGLATPTRTARPAQTELGAQSRDRIGDRVVVDDLAFAHDVARQRNLSEHTSCGGVPGTTSATVTALVPTSRPITPRAMSHLRERSVTRGSRSTRSRGFGSACRRGSRAGHRRESAGTPSCSRPAWSRQPPEPSGGGAH